jgi:hypothetical protein
MGCLVACDDDESRDATPGATPSAVTGSPAAQVPTPAPADFASLLRERADLPSADVIGLAAAYGLTDGRQPASKPFAGEPAIGSTRGFWVLDVSSAVLSGNTPPITTMRSTILRATSEHAYFYIDSGVQADQAAIDEAVDAFETVTWPRVTGAFGPPPSPGIDGDPRIVVVISSLGAAILGYHSNDDAYLRSVRQFSNEAEAIYLDSSMRLGGGNFNVVLAHELQHLIHSRNDQSEESWTNEGLSEVALILAGGGASSIDAFASRPDTQLNAWTATGSQPHYGAGAAFYRYLADRFGGDPALGDIAREPGDGAQGVDEFLRDRGQQIGFHDAFADWIAANILNLDEGPYANPTRPVHAAVNNSVAAGDTVEADARQFGTDYFRLPVDAGPLNVQFDGAERVPVLPVDIGDGVFWGNAQDDIDTTLTRELDLTHSQRPSLTFRTWFDIEGWYDWGYVSVSEDDGNTWKALAGEHTTGEDPAGLALGPGFTGKSDVIDAAWVDEQIDLTAYAGKKVLLRFEYVTDGASHNEGWLVDEIAVDGAPLSADGWDRNGWVLVDRDLPQAWIVRVIAQRADGSPYVADVPLDATQAGELRIDTTGLTSAVLAVAGATEGTIQESHFTVSLASP